MRALLIVDVQRDFTEGGALACAGGSAVAAAITKYVHENRRLYQLIVASRDWHTPGEDNGGHFAQEPDFIDTWPVHCVADTDGAQYHPSLDTSVINTHIYKGMGRPAYSAFEGVSEDGRSLRQVLQANQVNEVDVVGIAIDYCVKASVLDALDTGLQVRVLVSLTAAVSEAGAAQALADLESAGAQIIRD